jgi:HlyD family secretion protein
MAAALEPTLAATIRDTSAQDVAIDPAPRARRRRRRLAIAAIVAVLVSVVVGWIAQSWLSTQVVVARQRVRIATVTEGPFVRDAAAQGVIVAAESPTLFAAAPGTVTFNVNAGDAATKGQVLAIVDSPALENEREREQALLASLEVALERQDIDARRQALQNQQSSDLALLRLQAAEREFKRTESAWQQGAFAEREVARARDEVDTARLAYEHAKSNAQLQGDSLQFELKTKRLERDRQRLAVQNLTRQVEELNVRSPVTGVIGSLAVNQRSAVAENAPLLTVVDLSAFEVEFRVPETYATELAAGMAAQIEYGGKAYAGKVASISPEVKQNEVSGRVRFAQDAPPGLRQNQRVNLRILMDSRARVLKVERGGFVDAGSIAFVVDDDTAVRRPIQLGAMSIGEVEILGGLSAGERIIISGVDDFKDAAAVRLSD